MQLQIVCNNKIESAFSRHERPRPEEAAAAGEIFATRCHVEHSSAMAETVNRKPDHERKLRRAGVRITRPRRIILEVLSATEGHPDAMEIFQRASAIDSSISLSTVYRTMKLLEELGAIHRHAFEGGR